MGTIKAVLGVLLIIGAVYSGFQIIPPELSNYSYQDDLKNIAMMAGANPHQTDQDILDSVVKKAQERFGRWDGLIGNAGLMPLSHSTISGSANGTG